MTNTCFSLAWSKKYIGHVPLLVSMALLTALIVSSVNMSSVQAHGKPPKEIPTFAITKYGALGDGKTDDTKAIEAAIAAAVRARGGNLTAAPGTYCFSGPLTFPSGVTLTGSSMSAVIFKPTKSGAAFILQGTSGISSCTLDAQPGDGGYYLGTQDPNPTQRSVYGSAGARISLSKMNLASVVCIDCNAVVIENCTANSTVEVFGSRSIVLEKVNFAQGYLTVNADSSQKQSVGLSVISCTWPNTGGNSGGASITVGGGIARGASQGIVGCNFADDALQIYIQNDKSVAHTYFSFANNVFTGNSMESTLFLQNANPNVYAYVNGNQFNTVAIPGVPFTPIAAILAGPATASDVGLVSFFDNTVWAPVICEGGRISITSNKFSKSGQINCQLGSAGWVGPLSILSNSFSTSGTTSPYYSPIFVTLSPTDSKNVTGPVTIEKNKCTCTGTLPGYILVLDAPNDKTNISGNTVTPTSAVTTVVHTQAAWDALLQQLGQ
jgi:hypothetical protein